jgi:hypothetical protein
MQVLEMKLLRSQGLVHHRVTEGTEKDFFLRVLDDSVVKTYPEEEMNFGGRGTALNKLMASVIV